MTIDGGGVRRNPGILTSGVCDSSPMIQILAKNSKQQWTKIMEEAGEIQ